MLYLFEHLYFNTSWYPLLYFIFLQKLYASLVYKFMIVKSGFDIENTLLNNPDLVDLGIPNHSLIKYDELMGGVTL